MTDPNAPLVKITLADAILLRDEMREINKGLGRIISDFVRTPFEKPKVADVERSSKACDELIDRLTIAIHEAQKP